MKNLIFALLVTVLNSYFTAKIIGRKKFQYILLNNCALVIINNTNEKYSCCLPIEKRSENMIFLNKTLNIILSDVTFFYNIDVTAL